MAREKTPAPLTPTADMDHEPAADIAPSAIPVAAASIAPTHTRDRDPADREAWKRQRAAALGIPRD